MNYYLYRNGQQYGPYSLGDFQAMAAQGQLLPDDLAWNEGLTDWVPAFQVLGNLGQPPAGPPVPQPVPSPTPEPMEPGAKFRERLANDGRSVRGGAASPYAPQGPGAYGPPGGTGMPYQPPYYSPPYYGAAPYGAAPVEGRRAPAPTPPDFHWAAVWLLGMITCGLFSGIWSLVQANFVKKIDRDSSALVLYSIALGLDFIAVMLILVAAGSGARGDDINALSLLFSLPRFVVFQVANFSMRRSLMNYYNCAERFYLQLSGVMTFFFSILYFQYHFSRILQYQQRNFLRLRG